MLKIKITCGILTVISLIALAIEPSAQVNAGKGGEIIGRFDRAFVSLDTLIFGGSRFPDDIRTEGAFRTLADRDSTAISSELDSALRVNTSAKIREGNAVTGLEVTGQAYYRLAGNGGVDDVAGETGSGSGTLYRAKFQAELRWYLLQSSLFGKEGRRRIAEIEEEIARAGYEKERIDINEFAVKEQIDNHYDSLLYGVLAHRVALLTLLDDAQRYLLENEHISSDELVKITNERLEAERKLSEIERAYPPAPSLSGIRVTTVTIDSAALVKYVSAEQGDMKILELRMALLEQRERNIKWWADFRLAPFIRYAHYFRAHLPDSYNLDAGFTFTIPIDWQYKRKRETLRSERAVLESERSRLSRRVADKTANVIAEVDRLDRAAKAELRRSLELKGYISDRTIAYRKGAGEHNRLSRAKEYALYISCLERLVDYQYRRDCLVANLQSLLPDESILRFCSFRPVSVNDLTETQNSHF